MKKPFNKTKVGHFLTDSAVGKILVGSVDTFTGGLASNIIEETPTSPSGSADKIKAVGAILTALILIYLVVTGQITTEEAEQIKDIVE